MPHSIKQVSELKRFILPSILITLTAACGSNDDGANDQGPIDNSLPPIVTSFTPSTGAVGTSVRIEGLLFGRSPELNTVHFNGIKAPVTDANERTIVVDVPQGAKTGPIRISTKSGTKTTSKNFNVLTDTTTPGVAWTTRLNGVSQLVSGLAYNGETVVVVGDGIFTSKDKLVWQEQEVFLGPNQIIWDGQNFVAVGGSLGVYTSKTGNIWTAEISIGDADLYDLVKTDTMWIAVGEAGTIRTATDVTDWTTQTTPTTETLTKVAWNGTDIVALGHNGTVLTSNDGINWELRDAGTQDNFDSLGANDSLFVATTFPYPGSTTQILTSPDGVEWTSRASGLGLFSDIVFDNGQWVAVGSYKVATSTDGLVWNAFPDLPGNDIGSLQSVIYTGSEYLAVGSTGRFASGIYASEDGKNWTLRSSDEQLQTIAVSPVDNRLVVSGLSDMSLTSTDNGLTWQYGGLNSLSGHLFIEIEWSDLLNKFVGLVQEGANTGIHTADDGLNWTRIAGGVGNRGIASSPTLLVVLGGGLNGGSIRTSPDGIEWTGRANPATRALNDAIWTGSQFLAFGNEGNIVTSPDGLVWTKRDSGVTVSLKDAVVTPSLLVISGSDGTIITSSNDGVSWVVQDSGTGFGLNAVEWTGNEFVAVGNSGIAVRSEDGIVWQEQPTPYNKVLFGADNYHLNRMIWTNSSHLLIVGTRGLIATSP